MTVVLAVLLVANRVAMDARALVKENVLDVLTNVRGVALRVVTDVVQNAVVIAPEAVFRAVVDLVIKPAGSIAPILVKGIVKEDVPEDVLDVQPNASEVALVCVEVAMACVKALVAPIVMDDAEMTVRIHAKAVVIQAADRNVEILVKHLAEQDAPHIVKILVDMIVLINVEGAKAVVGICLDNLFISSGVLTRKH